MADKDSRNEALVLQTSAIKVRITANRKGHSKLGKYFGFLATGSGDSGLETARCLTRRKLFVVSIRSCHHTLGNSNYWM